MTDPQPLFRMRSQENRRAWLEGWLSAYNFTAERLQNGDDGKLQEILAESFRSQLQQLIGQEERNRGNLRQAD